MIRQTLALLVLFVSFEAFAEIRTVPFVDVNRYVGRWYQISRNPLPFEGDCYCSQQTLSLRNDGLVGVYNSCNNAAANGPLREIRGTASVDNPGENSKLTVDFGLPQKGSYWIIGLAEDYRYAVVTDVTGRALYILSKTPTMTETDFADAVSLARAQVATDKLKATVHEGCQYPPMP